MREDTGDSDSEYSMGIRQPVMFSYSGDPNSQSGSQWSFISLFCISNISPYVVPFGTSTIAGTPINAFKIHYIIYIDMPEVVFM